ncbi:MAG: coiled coil domain-containing protein [Methylomicrobium sp.]|nr:coiled coil domain-containing protein [Methylomicrobium sp.]
MKTKDEYIESMASELKEWSAQIDRLTVKAESAADDVKHQYVEELDVLHAKQKAAALKLKELEESSGDAWESLKQTADTVWDDLKTGISNTVDKFK